MDISSIENVNAIAQTDMFAKSGHTDTLNKTGADFSEWLANEISTANQQISEGNIKLREFAIGQTDNLHDVMMSIEKAKTSFELVVEVRNRLLEGYQEIMRMQI